MAKKAPEYPTTTSSSDDLYGTSTTSKSGTKYAPTDFQKNLVNTAQEGMLNNYGSLLSNDYSNDANYNTYKNQLRQQQANAFENNVVNNLINRGLLGTSGANSLANMYGSTMAQQESDLMDKYRSNILQNLNTSAQMYSMPYDMMIGTTGLSSNLANSVSSYNAQNYAADQARKAAMYQAIGTAVGGAAGGASGGSKGGGTK